MANTYLILMGIWVNLGRSECPCPVKYARARRGAVGARPSRLRHGQAGSEKGN